MTRFWFHRRARTLSSEQYAIFDNDSDLPSQPVGQADIHYLDASRFSASIVLMQDALDEESVEALIAALDDAALSAQDGVGDRHVVVFFASDSAIYDMTDLGEEDSEEEDYKGEIQFV